MNLLKKRQGQSKEKEEDVKPKRLDKKHLTGRNSSSIKKKFTCIKSKELNYKKDFHLQAAAQMRMTQREQIVSSK